MPPEEVHDGILLIHNGQGPSLHSRDRLQALSLAGKTRFDLNELNELVGYLYRRQLAEADLVVVSKIDLVPEGIEVIRRRYAGVLPQEAVIGISSLTGIGIDHWLESLMRRPDRGHADLELDYEKYASAEAALGWLNLSADWSADSPQPLRKLADRVLNTLQQHFSSASLKTAHVKVVVSSPAGLVKGSFVNNQGLLFWDDGTDCIRSSSDELIVNARAQGTPADLSDTVTETLKSVSLEIGIDLRIKRQDCFSPMPPRPTHRLSDRGGKTCRLDAALHRSRTVKGNVRQSS
jgi:hypothetical protein